MNSEAALIAAILREPDEDAHRLVYADLLEETGRAVRAAYIREQIALGEAETWETPHDGNAAARPWLTSGWAASPDSQWIAERGFLNWVQCDIQTWVNHAPAIVSGHPIQGVRIVGDDMGVWNIWGQGPHFHSYPPHQCSGVTGYGPTNVPGLPVQVLLLTDVPAADNAPTTGRTAAQASVPHQVNEMSLANAVRYVWPRIVFEFPPYWTAHAPSRAPA